MIIGQRLREIREEKGLSQGDVERASGLLRCYISRVEHGHTVPSLETLERFAAALGVPLYRIFSSHDATKNLTARRSLEELAAETGPSGTEARFLLKIRGLFQRIKDADRAFLLAFARRLVANRSQPKAPAIEAHNCPGARSRRPPGLPVGRVAARSSALSSRS